MILVDVHEPESILAQLYPLGVSVALDTGDYSFYSWQGERVTIERKAISDLTGSIASGRLADQLVRLTEECDVPILLTEGPVYLTDWGNIENIYWKTISGTRKRFGVDTNWRYMDVLLALVSAWLCLGVLPLYVESKEWTPKVITELYRWFQKPESHGGWIVRPKKGLTLIETSIPKIILGGIPGVGLELAESLLKGFKTLQAISLASVDELKATPKIGKKKAEAIYQAFREEHAEEGRNE